MRLQIKQLLLLQPDTVYYVAGNYVDKHCTIA
jgi:hypothetical protein